MTFVRGQSGNPRGRKKGSRNAVTRERDKLRTMLERAAPNALKKAIELARAGDAAMIALLVDRALPKLKPTTRARKFPINPEASPQENARELVKAVAAGDLCTEDAEAALALVNEATALERLTQLEQAILDLFHAQGRELPASLAERNARRTGAPLQ